MRFQVFIVLHDACIYRISFATWKEFPNRKFFVWCGYGLHLQYGKPVFQLRCTLNRTVGNNCPTDNRTAPNRTVRFSKNKNRTKPHRVISKTEKPHHGAVLHREKPRQFLILISSTSSAQTSLSRKLTIFVKSQLQIVNSQII